MKLYRCAWPNGDVSFVRALDKADAVRILDEIASADDDMLTVVTEPSDFFVSFTPCDDPECPLTKEISEDADDEMLSDNPTCAHWHAQDDEIAEHVWELLGNAALALKKGRGEEN